MSIWPFRAGPLVWFLFLFRNCDAQEARLSKLLDEAKQVFAEASVEENCVESTNRAELLLQKLMEEPLLVNSSSSESLHIKRLKIALFSTYGLLKEEKGEPDKALSLYSKTLCVVSECEESGIISYGCFQVLTPLLDFVFPLSPYILFVCVCVCVRVCVRAFVLCNSERKNLYNCIAASPWWHVSQAR